MSDLRSHEALVERYVRDGNNSEAINSLLFLITKHAQQRDFETADALRERIISIDPMALSDAIQAQEIIDSTRMKPVDSGHLEVWSGLYERLIDHESRGLYNAMEEASFRPGQVVYSEGAMNSNLYFIDSGQAKHIYTRHGREIFIKKIMAGNVAGEESFFNASCCTTTLVATNQVKVHFLSYDRLKDETKEVCDVLAGKLQDFCARGEKIQDMLKGNAQDRRKFMRVPFKGSVLIKHPEIQAAKSLKGEMIDVSSGGISFSIEANSKEQAQMLLGRTLSLRFNLPPQMQEVERVGLVLAVRNCATSVHDSEQYSVHLEFDDNLPEKHIRQTNNYARMIN